jgi:hypothetical protein
MYREMLDDDVRRQEIRVTNAGEVHDVTIPSNYGQIYITPVLAPI